MNPSQWTCSRRGVAATLLAAWTSLCGTGRLQAQQPALSRAIDAYIDPYVQTHNFSGQLLVARNGTIVYERSLGWADREHRTPMTPNSRLHIASMSMQFSAAAIMRLVDQGRLTLDTHVAEIVPAVRGGDRITIRNLLEMRSGLSDINARTDYDSILQHHQTPASLMNVVAGDSLLFPPGSRYAHEEHSAYNLIALVIEKKSGQPFARAMQELVFAPAGMAHSGADGDESRVDHLALGYAPKGTSSLEPAALIHWSAKAGNASVYSTARDEARWVEELLHGKLLSGASRDVILDTAGVPIGYGWFRRPNTRFREMAYSMSGRSPGFASFLVYLPREKLLVVALSNIYSSATTDLGYDIAAIALGMPTTAVALSANPFPPDSMRLEGAHFTFPADFYQPNATLAFRVIDGDLFMLWPSGNRSPIIPIDRNHAIDRAYWEPLLVSRDAAGRATSLTYDRFRGERVEGVPTSTP